MTTENKENFTEIKKEFEIRKETKLLKILLKDRTTKKNIIWATDSYCNKGEDFFPQSQIYENLITNAGNELVQPRVKKDLHRKTKRTKDKAEVFTPSWLCNAQNNLIDDAWFGKKNVFNVESTKSWKTNMEIIKFNLCGEKTWKDYVDSPRIEITCGEAPYLVSRYDSVSGEPIKIQNRIGLLDRKLRIVNENTQDEKEWFKFVLRAYQSIYGYEFQGDNLFLARENLLYTFTDNLKFKFKREATTKELREISNIITWNIWQMDGLKFTIPYSDLDKITEVKQLSFFDEEQRTIKKVEYCLIKDWLAIRKKEEGIIEYQSLFK